MGYLFVVPCNTGWPMGYLFVVPYNTGWPINHCPHLNQIGQWGTYLWSHATPSWPMEYLFVVSCNSQLVGYYIGCQNKYLFGQPVLHGTTNRYPIGQSDWDGDNDWLANWCCMGPQIGTLLANLIEWGHHFIGQSDTDGDTLLLANWYCKRLAHRDTILWFHTVPVGQSSSATISIRLANRSTNFQFHTIPVGQ